LIFGNLKKIYYKNSFLIQDLKTIYFKLIGRKYKNGFIKGVTVIPTTYCNANCGFCGKRYLIDRKKTMPFKTFKKIISQLEQTNIHKINLTPIIGEVFLDKGIFKKINYASKRGFEISFYTNAFFLEGKLHQIKNAPIKEIRIDMGDIVPEYDSRVFNVPVELSERKMFLIGELIKNNTNKKISLHPRPIRNPAKILKDLKKTIFWKFYLMKKLQISYLTAYDNWGGLISEKDLEGFQVIKRPPLLKKYPCKGLSEIVILPDGSIRLCGCRIKKTFKDELVVGNIHKNQIQELVNSQEYLRIFKDFQEGKIPQVCKRCTFYKPMTN
jgi:radical SAM protein with 4Fe4S-binding SPASM domain